MEGKFGRSQRSTHQDLTPSLKTAQKKKQTGARIDEDLFYEVQLFAVTQRTTFQNVVEQALREYLDKYNKA